MIRLWIGEELLDLYPDTRIAFEESNPMFKSVGELGKVFSYPFKFPTSPTNSQILKFAQVINVVRSLKSYAVRVEYNGVPFATGELLLLNRTPIAFEASLQVKRRLPWVYDRKMSELYEIGYFCMPDSPMQKIALVAKMDNEALRISINGIIFVTDSGSPISKLNALADQINAKLLETGGVFASVFPPANRLILQKANPNSDFTIFALADSKGDPSMGYDTYDDSGAISTKFYQFANTVNSNPDDYGFCYPMIINGGAKQADLIGTNEIASDWFGILNHHNGTEFLPDPQTKRNAFCAQLKVGNILEKICQKYGWQLQSEWLATTAKNLCVFNNHSVVQQTYGATAGKSWLEYYWLYAHKLPDITLSEFLNELQKVFFLLVDFDYANQTLKVEPLKTVMNSAKTQLVESFSENYSLGEERFKSFRYEYELGSNLKKIAEEQKGYFSYDGTGTGETAIKSKLTFVPSAGIFSRTGADRSLFAEQLFFVGKLPEKDRPKMLFLFEKKGNSPRGTHFNDLINLQWKSGGIGFNVLLDEGGVEVGWEQIAVADRGLFAIYGNEWDALMRESVEVERELYLTTAELLSFQKTNLWRVDHANYWIVRYSYQLGNEAVSRHKVKAILRIWNSNKVGEYTSGGGTGGGGSGGGGGVEPPPILRRNLLVEFFKMCLKRDLTVEFYEGCAPTFTVTIDLVSCE